MSKSASAIVCEKLSKRYYLRHNDANPLRRVARRLANRSAEYQEHWALQDVDLEILQGDSVALIGLNGSGKSTLLRLISGITRETSGRLLVGGRVGGILDLGGGFHQDLTGYENIFLQATLLGLSRQEIWSRLKSIEDFCELGKFLNSPVRHFSMGMFLRLSFAIAVHTDPEIFIIDEALAVGDGYFQWKCLRKLDEFKREGRTILYVSHMPESAECICSKAAWIHQGRLREFGPITEIVHKYNEFLFENLLQGDPPDNPPELSALIPYSRFGTGEVNMRRVSITDAEGNMRRTFSTGDTICVEVDAEAKINVPEAALSFILERPGQPVTFAHASEPRELIQLLQGMNRLRMRIPAAPLRPGTYYLTVAIGEAGLPVGHHTFDAHQKIYTFNVVGRDEDGSSAYSHGIMVMPAFMGVQARQPASTAR